MQCVVRSKLVGIKESTPSFTSHKRTNAQTRNSPKIQHTRPTTYHIQHTRQGYPVVVVVLARSRSKSSPAQTVDVSLSPFLLSLFVVVVLCIIYGKYRLSVQMLQRLQRGIISFLRCVLRCTVLFMVFCIGYKRWWFYYYTWLPLVVDFFISTIEFISSSVHFINSSIHRV